MVAASSADREFRDIAVVGGGCYGSFYAGQLAAARLRGALRYRQVLVRLHGGDRASRIAVHDEHRRLVVADWGEFFDQFLVGDTGSGDAIVPSPLMPHPPLEPFE